MARRALITGVTGQDGAYLSRLLLEKGYDVVGGSRASPARDLWRLKALGIDRDVRIVDLELLDSRSIVSVIERERPDEIYNLAAQSVVSSSFHLPVLTGDADALGVARILEAITGIDPSIRFYQASSSEMFGDAPAAPQSEGTPFRPRSPYGAAKLYAHWMTVNARNAGGLFACSGIVFNHESPLRGLEFVTRKITHGFARIAVGRGDGIELGNLDATRDWGSAPDYVEAMWRMLHAKRPDDYVLATGQSHSVRSFCKAAAQAAGFDLTWHGSGTDEVAVDAKTGRVVVRVNEKFYRPNEPIPLVGDPTKARRELGWQPRMSFEDLVRTMVEEDLRRLRR
ncbi:GDP-mannose 4,6-dehydratase [Bradyrhizobium sp. CCBAU 53338]|uniref:GDP-mannose 4,6-dehydratase n=1 Tax=Bradyrhizobium sp. CCBAU 53338 TaxID=1325111 RepID=UPI00188A9C41|nr:GDP-mannose 4,6-dehydratase [Bradyrhizobium sp. CCBAU 53338]QOZ52001.1 GDP-mannose 4,6-dehydratase [Bradyrhizobium sp. CCBAU 53338]